MTEKIALDGTFPQTKSSNARYDLPQKLQPKKLDLGDLVARDYVLKFYLTCIERLSFTERQAEAEVV